MKSSGYGATLSSIAARAASAIVARGNIRSDAARAMLLRRLSAAPGQDDSLIAPPVYEAARIWQAAEPDMAQLSGALLRPDLVNALDEAGAEAIPKDRHPYWHQHEAWKSAAARRSYMVTSGTGSGKTECFMVPMLNDLLNCAETGARHGVRGLILYPLNALIDSQRERLGAWIAPFHGRISYALYNGDTPETRNPNKRPAPSEIADRKSLRKTPANLLVTNVTMLEYMLTRAQDRGILEQSQGQLRWIVLDEAHSYVGAQAAEMALLLRRVRQAFGVKPEDVRLVATSATIGEGPDTTKALKRFVASLGGVDPEQVDIIMGREEPLSLPTTIADGPIEAIGDTPEALWSALAPHPRAQRARAMLRAGGARLDRLAQVLVPETCSASEAEIILDAMAQAQQAPNLPPLSPWRLNAFERSQAGLWACVDPACTQRAPELCAEGSDWPYGQIHLFQREHCSCGAPVFEIGSCSDCGTPWLLAHEEIGKQRILRQSVTDTEEDDFRLDVEPGEDGEGAVVGEACLIGPADEAHPMHQLRHTDAVVRDVETSEPGHSTIRICSHEDRGCCSNAHHARSRVAVQRFGSPFLLGSAIPQLLEAMPRPEGIDGPAPMGGRRLLSFTDSRQGTARFAAKLQQEAERGLTRAAIWHAVQGKAAGDPTKAADLRLKIAQLEAIPGMESIVAEQREKLAEAEGGFAPIPWSEMLNILADVPDLRSFGGEVWQGRSASHPFGGLTLAKEPVELAKLLLLREIFRRPKLQNNVETMGFARLCWPELERQMSDADVPAPLREAGHDATVWVALGQAAIDLAFRNRLAVQMERNPVDLAHWISPRQAVTQVVEPGLEFDNGSTKRTSHRWWTATSKAGLVQIIYRLIGGSIESSIDRDRSQSVLDALWTALVRSKVLTRADPACWQLDFTRSALIGMEHAWQCPVTGKILPYSVAGTTLNEPSVDKAMAKIALPRLPIASPAGLTETERLEVENWLANDETVATLRNKGLWTDLQDRAAAFAPFLRAQEHSAQIDRASLKDYEEAFRKGRINILNCSTTMEMGVDIPNVGTVVNTNVPPAPSNYRQRIGRAGRRGEPWAMSFTFCKDKPLDWQVFRNPETLLRAEIPAPAVRLDSPVMTSRHVNALLLGMFLRREGGLSIQTAIGSFFGAQNFRLDDDLPQTWVEGAMADQFLSELDSGWAREPQIAEAIALLVRGTALEGKTSLPAATATAFADLAKRWRLEYERLVDGWRAASPRSPEKAFYANRAKRMRREFLMTELARRGFTPAYGFPVDVVTFDHIGGDGGKGPSRQLDIAIRDYAPGSEIVIDGLVHRSDGILPAWSNTADADSLDDLRSHWRCKTCAAFGLSRENVHVCPQCGDPAINGELLRPSGFLGRRKPHAGYEQVSFVAPDRPRVSSGDTPWLSLADPSVGRLRASRQGHVLFTAPGQHGHGYAICLACGQAEPETGSAQDTPLSRSMATHWPLQPIRNNPRHDGKCPGGDESSRKIRRNVVLGNEITTDVFEWQLRDLGSAASDRSRAMAIAAALREALAKSLGIEAEDMGIASAPSLLEDGNRAMSVFLFDRASGGAGFAPLAQDSLPDIVDRASRILDCPAHCASGCPECILRGDLQYDMALMDRPGALETLNGIRDRLKLPAALKLFGESTRALPQALPDWLAPRMRSGHVSELALFMHGEPSTWDLRDLAARLPRRDEARVAQIVLQHDVFMRLEMPEKVDLVRFLAECGARLHGLKTLPKQGKNPVLCQFLYEGQPQAVAAQAEASAVPDGGWGQPEEGPMLLGTREPEDLGQRLSAEKLVQFNEGNSIHRDAGTQFDRSVGHFGHAFWKLIREMRPQLARDIPLAAVTYSDRYLRAPLPLRLLFEVLRTMPDRKEGTVITVNTAEQDRDNRFLSRTIEDNWTEDRVRLQTMRALLHGADVRILPRKLCPHPRSFELIWQDGRSARIHLDQGLGSWTVPNRMAPRFDVEDDPLRQAATLAKMSFEVRNRQQGGVETPIWVSW
ncbi:DEAD/DEAH box helicase [Mangrovicoccus sp. HB161399]|uniref:DEAD/DEAH box helicase n=1 Tax=Mangrovicoccus sp. HB161399 TaxID=2720392 RepID=UPI001554DA6B|nr:DEAD/DEAH box helicase [Mangrovicoccus sp. HB161399]